MLKILLPAFLLLNSAVQAKDITVTLNDEDQKNLSQVIDLALRGGGVQALSSVNLLVARFSQPPVPTPSSAKPVDEK